MKKIILLFLILFFNHLTFSQCLSGNYTIGGASPSFTSITQAVNTLTVNGVCGPVTFNIRPGTYNERIALPVVAGTSSVNTITFQSETADSSSTIIQAVGNSTQNYVVKLDGTDYVSIKNLTLKNTDANYMCLVYLINGVVNFNLSNCVIDAPVTSSILPNANRYLINSATPTNVNCIIQNSKISGGQRAIYASSNSSLITDFRILNCIFLNQYEYSISLSGVRAPKIISNKISYNLANTGFKGMYISSSNDVVVIDRNSFDQTLGESISLFFATGNSTNYSSVSNNRINISGGATGTSGIYLQNASYMNVYHNSVVSVNTNTNSSCVALYTMANVNIKNNIFYHKGVGVVYYIYNTLTNAQFDYNDIYYTGSRLAFNISTDVPNFGAWKGFGYDSNSLNYLPQFVSASDFHIASDFSQNLPIPFLPSVPIDIEGTLRDNISPYFGAYEFANTLNVTDASINKIELTPYNCVGNNPVNVLLKNLGSASLNSVTINWSVNGAIQTPFNWSGNLNFYDTISATIGNLNFVNLGTYNVKAWTTLPNGTTDAVALNDSASSGTLYTSLNGIYTVGGASPSFTNLTSAVTNLKNRGVCGNVTFNLRNGTYNESLNLPAINGLNGANSLLIQSESGNNTSVQIVSTTTLNTVLFSGASNVTIKNMTIGGSSILANAVVINSGGNNLEINNCIINAQSYYGIQSSLSSGGVNQLRILNNTFSSGYYSVYLTGSTTYKFTNLKVVNNTITSGTNSHITVSNADTLDFNENKAITPNTNGPAISITNSNKINVLKNKVNTKDSPALSVTNTSNALIANNMLMGYGSSASSVLNIYGTNSTHIIHNSINSITTNTNCYTFYYYSNNYTGSGNHVWNNIIQNDGMSIPVYVNNSSYQPRFKNNVYSYSGSRFGNFNGAMVQNLTDWKTTSLTDTNSVMLNPQFVSSTDLHANEILLNNAGVSTIADISDDVDGDIRNVSTPDIGADEFVPLSVDAATNGFNFNSILCAGTNPVQVVLKNNGSTTLNSAKLNCKVNSTTLSVYNWSGSLAPGTQTLVTIGTYSFALGTSYSIKAWSTLPNGISDVFRNNDTTSKVFLNTGMSGIYTIGGTSPDFSTINSAVAALKNGGLCGPVTFNVRNGIYNEQVKIPSIKGVSATSTILFQSQSMDSSLVSIEYAGTSTANYVLTVDSTDYITFYKLGFKTLSTSYSNILSFTNKTTHVQLKNCSFTGQTSNGNLLSMSANCDSSLISNNRFYRGSTSIFLAAASNSVMNNYFEDQSQYSIYGNGYNLTYSSNKFYFPTLSGQAIYVYGTSGGKISKNKISYNGNNVSAIGLYNCGSLANPVYVTNNFISVNGTGSGIDLSNLQYVNVIHNSINQTGNGSCVSIGTVNNSLCQNNIFYNSTGYCITTNTLNPSFSRNYNCIYSPVNKLISVGATTYSTLAAYTATTSMEANSISNDPLYTTFSDLHITNSAAINGSALYNSNVTDDIDGDIRSNTTPDMGADEFVLLNIGNDVQVLQVYVSNQGCGGAQTLYAKIKNIGVNNLSSVQLSGKVAGTPISQVAWSGNLAQGQVKDSISLGTISSLYGNTTIKIWTFSPNGAADGNLINDTLVYQTPNNALKGMYKIGGASPDFVSLRAAKNALQLYGICGPVTFNIRPGTYQDTLSIPSVVGSSSLNVITFQSENGDSSSVIISDFPAAAVLYPHYAIQLRNISNVVFSKLTFQQNVITNGNNASLLYGYYNYGNYSNILIQNCRFIGNSLTSYAVNLASMQSLQNFQFKNNTVLNGAYGINLSNINTNASTLIKDNQFYNQLSTSISYGTVTGTNTIENNTIKNTNSATGININQTYSITIRGNKVVTYTGVGINVNSGTATIFNNFVLVKNASTVNGLFLNGLSNNSKVSFNTVRVKSTGSVVYAQYTGLNLQNNIFENKGTGQVYNLYSLNTSTITNNRCYTNGTVFGNASSTNYSTFTAWKTATGFDSNSQNSSTYFLNDSSYKISGDYNLNGKAIPIASIADDIEYQPRNASTPDIGAYEFDLQNNDAGITRFINPLDSVLCNGNNSISVVLRNFGALALNSCNINWKLNSVVQPVYSWTGALASGDSTVVTIGSVNIVGGRRNKLSIYTSLPNGSVDLANANDSLSTKSIKTRLSGNYTIGGVLPNYSTLKQAADSLQMYGVCGPVTYSIRDGIYNSKFNLSNVIGTSAVNSVVFQSQSMDSSLVTISDTGQAISLYSVKYFTFRKLRFNQASNYNYPSIAVGGASGNIAVTNCIFSNSYSSSNYVYGSIRLSVQDSANRNFVFKQNNFSTTNIVFDNSSSTLHPRNVVVSDNYFSNGAYVLFNNVDSLVFSRNKFYNSNGNVVINVQNCNRELFVVNNISRNGSISIQNCNGNSFSKQVVNNLLDSANISLSNVPKIDIYHNTISLNSPSVNGYACIAITGDMALQRIRNNILSNVANGVCLKIYDPLFNGSNYPNIFSNNVYNTTIDTLGYSSALGFFTKSNWVNILNQDQNSVFARPAFVSNHDFHITNDHNINDLGAPNSLSLVDLDGVARNVSAPDVGVYEFNSAITTNDAGILNVQTPNGNCDRISNDISVLLKNFGTNALTSANITWSLNNTGTTTYSWTGSLAPGATTLISVGSYTPQNMLSHITAYSSLPNGNTDGYIHNDTLISTLSLPKLNGIYTVGGSSADFSTFADVLNSLQTNGICGPVTFKFNPGGYTSLYSNAFDITNIQGNNSQNTITFESASQNNSNVVFTDLAMTLKYVTGITFRNVTFSKSNIVLGVNSKKITFEGNIFNDYPVYNSGIFSMITSNSYFEDLTIKNNRFSKCQQDFIVFSHSTIGQFPKRVVIKGNLFYDPTYTAMDINNIDSLVIDSNIIQRVNTSSYSNCQGIRILSPRDYFKISRNKISGTFETGIFIYTKYGNHIGNSSIQNNVIIGSPLTTSNISISCDSLSVLYNSLYLPSTYTTYAAFNAGYKCKILNNIISTQGARVMAIGSSTTNVSDYNIFYTPGTVLINSATNLAAYTASTGLEAHSTVANPQYVNNLSDLHYQNHAIDGKALPLANVLIDQQNKIRSVTTPNPGAYEAAPDTTVDYVHKSIMLKTILTPTLTIGANNAITASVFYYIPQLTDTNVYKYRGTIDSLRMHYQVNNQPEVIEKWNGALHINDSLSYTFNTPFYVPNGKLYSIKVWFENLNPNQQELNILDDSLRKEIILPMKGDYTFGGTYPDFPDFMRLYTSINKCSIIGDTRFLMRPGHHGSFYTLTNPLYNQEFRPESGNPNEVSINLMYAGAKYKLTKLTIIPAYGPSAAYGPFDGMQTSSSDMILDSCWIRGGTDLSSRVGFNFFQNYSGNSATIRNCRFTNLQFAVYFSAINNYSGGGYATHDFVFENNVIDSCDYGLIIFSFKSPYWLRVKNNAITTYSAGIYFETNTHWSDIYPGNLEFSSNTIHSQQEGIRYGNWNDIILGTELVLKNNMVSSVLPSTLPISYKLKLFNNTFNNKVQATARDSAEIYNNLFANLDTLDGYYPVPGYTYENSAFALYYVPGKLKSNNNNFYTPHFARKVQYNTTSSAIPYSVINTYSFTSVPQIYSALGVEKNSLSFTPLFVSNTNLHSRSAYMKNTGCAIPSLTVDIDGDIRPSDPLDIGADEIQIPFTGVWPGDANADLQVTSQDLYSVGLHYGNHHYQRDSVSNAFVGQLCNDWNVNQIGSTVDMKFADCNGDSLIDMNDTLAINLNYNLTHLPKLNATNTNTLDITLVFNKTLYLPGDTVKADVMIGSPVNVQNSIYGASFKIAYEVAKVKPNSEKMIFINSWMGNINSTKIKFSHIDRTQGLLDASVVRITHSDVTGYGKVGTFQFVLNDTQTSQSMGVSIIDADKVNTGAIITPLIPGQDSIIVVPNSVATYVTENTVNEVSVYPNPASDYVKVNFGNTGNVTYKLELSAMDGKVILTKTASGNRYTLNLQGVAKGVYALKITMEDGSNKVFKLVIQ